MARPIDAPPSEDDTRETSLVDDVEEYFDVPAPSRRKRKTGCVTPVLSLLALAGGAYGTYEFVKSDLPKEITELVEKTVLSVSGPTVEKAKEKPNVADVVVMGDTIPNPWIKRETSRPVGDDIVGLLVANRGACAMYTLTCDKGQFVPGSGGFDWRDDCPEPSISDWTHNQGADVDVAGGYGTMSHPFDVCAATKAADGKAITLSRYF